jgi:pyrroline-5-carboxylate reductase
MKVSILGGGTIGEALAKGFSTVEGVEVSVAEVIEERRRFLEKEGIRTYASSREASKGSDVVVVAVKPRDVKPLLDDVKDLIKGKLVISVAAGVKLSYLEKAAPDARFIRAMPNIAAAVKGAVTTLTPSAKASEDDLRLAEKLFGSVGYTLVVDEALVDAVTGLSGSGPAYIFLVIEALAEGGLKMGIPYEKALQLASWVVYGAAKMVIEAKQDPAALRRKVATPAGTTIEGLLKLEEAGVRAAFVKAVEAASKRAAEISKEISGQ